MLKNILRTREADSIFVHENFAIPSAKYLTNCLLQRNQARSMEASKSLQLKSDLWGLSKKGERMITCQVTQLFK